MSDLFAPLREPTPAPAPPPQVAAPRERPASWRRPTRGEDVCYRCQGAACYSEGATYFCRPCAPIGFLPHTRGPA